MSKKQLAITIISIIILALIGGGAVWYVKTQKQEINNPPVTENENQPAEIINQQSEIINTEDWQTYRNEEYGFEMKYPEGWKIKEENNKLSFIDPDNYEDFYKWTEMQIGFWDNVDNLEEKILEPFKKYGYKTIYDLVEKEFDVYLYSNININGIDAHIFSLGSERRFDNYYLPSQKKNKSYIEASISYSHKLKNLILSTIKLY